MTTEFIARLLTKPTGSFSFWSTWTDVLVTLTDSNLTISSIGNDTKSPLISVDFKNQKAKLSVSINSQHVRTVSVCRQSNSDSICDFQLADDTSLQKTVHYLQQLTGQKILDFASAARLIINFKRCLKKRHLLILNTNAAVIQNAFRAYTTRLRFQHTIHSIILVQKYWRRYQCLGLLDEMREEKRLAKLHDHRTRVMLELYATEESYVSNLDVMINVYVKPLRALEKRIGVSGDQVSLIFSNVEDIAMKHRDVLAELKVAMDGWTDSYELSSVFIKMSEWLPIYITYCNNFDLAKQALHKCSKLPGFQAFIEQVNGMKSLQRQDLSSLLILPIQRIPRYELLLRDVLKHTWPSHPDFDGLTMALQRIKEAARQVNRAKSYRDSKHRLASLQPHMNPLSASHKDSVSSVSNTNMANTVGRTSNAASYASSQTYASTTLFNSGPVNNNAGPDELEQKYIGEGAMMFQEVVFTRQAPELLSPTAQSEAFDLDSLLNSVTAASIAVPSSSTKVAIPAYAFLFNDLLVISRRSKGHDFVPSLMHSKKKSHSKRSLSSASTFKYTHLVNLDLGSLKMDECVGQDRKREQEYPIHLTTATDKTYRLTMKSLESKRKWILDLIEAIAAAKVGSLPSPSPIEKPSSVFVVISSNASHSPTFSHGSLTLNSLSPLSANDNQASSTADISEFLAWGDDGDNISTSHKSLDAIHALEVTPKVSTLKSSGRSIKSMFQGLKKSSENLASQKLDTSSKKKAGSAQFLGLPS